MENRITQELVSEALHMAIKQRKPLPGLYSYIQTGVVNMPVTLTRYYLKETESYVRWVAKGIVLDNAVMESFYRTLKVELIYLKKYETRIEAKRDIFEYIEIFYNRERLHSFLGYNSPEEYEKMTMVA